MGEVVPFVRGRQKRASAPVPRPKRRANAQHAEGVVVRWYMHSDGTVSQDTFIHVGDGTYRLCGLDSADFAGFILYESEMEARHVAEAYLLHRIARATALLQTHRDRVAFLEKLDG